MIVFEQSFAFALGDRVEFVSVFVRLFDVQNKQHGRHSHFEWQLNFASHKRKQSEPIRD